MNITFDDISPVFRWNEGTPVQGGTTWHRLYGQQDFYSHTYHHTYAVGTSMELTFNGTGVYLFGRQRDHPDGYSTYTVDDGPTMNSIDLKSRGDGYNDLFAAQTGLDPSKEHVLKWFGHPALVNDQYKTTAFVIDYAVITLPAIGTIYSTVIDDESPMWKYSGDGWARSGGNIDSAYNRTQHSARAQDSVKLSFRGSSIGIYGTVGGDVGNYSVSIDGVDKGTFPSNYATQMRQATMYVASGLEDIDHELLIRNIPVSVNKTWFGLDYAVVNSSTAPISLLDGTKVVQAQARIDIVAPDPSSSISSSPSSSSSASSSSDSAIQGTDPLNPTPIVGNEPVLDNGLPQDTNVLSTPSSKNVGVPISTVVGAAIGSVVGLLIFVILLVGALCYRKRRDKSSLVSSSSFVDLGAEKKGAWHSNPLPPPLGATGAENRQPAYYYSPAHLGAAVNSTSNPFGFDSQHALFQPPPVPAPSQRSNYPYSVYPPSSSDGNDEYQNPFFGQSPPATPSSRQGAGSRGQSAPSTIASPLTPSSPSSLPYHRRSTRPANLAPSSSTRSTIGSIRRSYQLWTHAFSGSRPSQSRAPLVPSLTESPLDGPNSLPSRPPQASRSSEAVPHPMRLGESSNSSGTLPTDACLSRKSLGVDAPLTARPTSSVIAFSDRMRKAGREVGGGDGGPMGVEEGQRTLQPPDYEQTTRPLSGKGHRT